MNNIFLKNQKGYAMLFTVVIISAISVITAGLTSAIYKQMVLSSLAKDSQIAFYQADTASDCALYSDLVKVMSPDSTFLTDEIGDNWKCGNFELKKKLINPEDPTEGYILSFLDENTSDPCFKIEIRKTLNNETVDEDGKVIPKTDIEIRAKGYNICDKTNPRTVEREIQVNYKQNNN